MLPIVIIFSALLTQEKLCKPEFYALMQGCQMLLGHQLPLADYLLKPVQRLLKYPLLIAVGSVLPLIVIVSHY